VKRSQITVRGGTPPVQSGSEFSNFHLAAVARENFQYARQPVNDLNRRAPADHGLFSALSSWF